MTIVIAATAFAAVFAFAATLGVTSNTLGAGSDEVVSCDPATGVAASYTTAYDATVPGYKVTNVTLSDIVAACQTKPLKVTLTGPGASDASLVELTGTATGATLALPVATTVSAADVTGIHVVIAG